MGTKPNMVREAITPSIAKNNFYTVKKNHKHLKEKKSVRNKSDKGKWFDKSRSTQRTETEDKVK